METMKHSDTEDDLNHWRNVAKQYQQKATDLQHELDEYTENSAQLEKELEASLEHAEKSNCQLMQQNQRLNNEIEILKNKLERSRQESLSLEGKLQTLKNEKEKQAAYIRELEQKNDDLERGQRVISESVSYIEALLNQAYERNAVLESEVDEVENLRVKLQRATDEARDLKQELKVIERLPNGVSEENLNNMAPNLLNGHVNSTSSRVESETQTNIATPFKRELNGNAMTPSSRISAMNIVGDLLRKVGALESKLSSCRGSVRPKEGMPHSTPEVSKDYRTDGLGSYTSQQMIPTNYIH